MQEIAIGYNLADNEIGGNGTDEVGTAEPYQGSGFLPVADAPYDGVLDCAVAMGSVVTVAPSPPPPPPPSPPPPPFFPASPFAVLTDYGILNPQGLSGGRRLLQDERELSKSSGLIIVRGLETGTSYELYLV
eukprot:scaffold250086_cov35-Prasinocladus_malaysianus.AAC.1